LGEAKRIEVKPISHKDADRVVAALHYSGKAANPNSLLHLGVFLDGRCGGALQLGPPLDKSKLIGLVKDTPWHGFLELNRLAFADWLPRNSESRALAVTFRILRKSYPHIQWVVSFADATQCGDGTIYRAAGFVLTAIKKNTQVWTSPEGGSFSRTSLEDNHSPGVKARAQEVVHRVTLTKERHARQGDGSASMKLYKEAGFTPLPGFQIRYIYFLDPTAKARLTVPILPYSAIQSAGAGMYKGQPKRVSSVASDTPPHQGGEGGARPTETLMPASEK
jgi:hypothetical protein